MAKLKIIGITSFLILFAFMGPLYAASVAKIGLINFQRILKESSAGKSAQAEITEKGKKMKGDLEKKGADIKAKKEKFDRDVLVMSREKKEEKERELRHMITDLKSDEKKYMEDFKRYEVRLLNRIKKDVLQIVKNIGKKGNYLLIIEDAGVLYAPDSVDITSNIIKSYNAEYAKNK
ncbi:OmpH family outer membrane protein [Desulfobacterales bacterium HSG16]|nr:OmpH family outer membrane protein [Desulfobacterales bacterium HSG16]